MAQITGTSLSFVSTLLDDANSALAGAFDLRIVDYPTGRLAFVLGNADQAIGVVSIGEDGTLASVGTFLDNQFTFLENLRDIQVIDPVFGGQFLAVSSPSNGGVTLFNILGDAPYLTWEGTLAASNTGYNLHGNVAFATLNVTTGAGPTLTFKTYLFAAGSTSDGITVFDVPPSGDVTILQNVENDPNAGIFLDGVTDIARFSFGGTTYLASVSQTAQALTIFEIGSGGILTQKHFWRMSASTKPNTLAVHTTEDATFCYILESPNDTIMTVRYTQGGLMLLQRFGSAALLGGIRDADIVMVGDEPYLAVTAAFADTVSLFAIDTDPLSPTRGYLSPVVTTGSNSAAFDLAWPNALDSYVDDKGQTHLLVVESVGDAVTLISLGDGDDVLDGTLQADTIKGFGGDDTIHGFEGSDEIDGGPGDDVVFGDSGDDVVHVSAGQDVSYGGSGTDLFDASDCGSGVTVDFIRNEVELADGTLQFIFGFENITGTAFDDTLIGSDGANAIEGGSGDDLIRGRAGDDVLTGGAGNDQLVGADGDDVLDGGGGADRIAGGAGDDAMSGGDGADIMFGGAGGDQMDGGAGADRLKGNDGNDSLAGGLGNDRLEGNQGDDFLRGQAGDDTILGGGGRDRINGGSGDDALTGGSAIDTFVFLQVPNGGGGTNTITDFQDGLDLLDISDYGYADAGQVLGGASQVGADVEIALADGQRIVLLGTELAALDAGDFVL
jgi:Ca2+-binding RTX toxin-like protein